LLAGRAVVLVEDVYLFQHINILVPRAG
jgi:hypothetical protein